LKDPGKKIVWVWKDREGEFGGVEEAKMKSIFELI